MSRRWMLFASLTSAALFFVACGEDDPKTNPKAGYTACGDHGGSPVECSPGQYCSDATFSDCTPGCTSNENCLASEACVKSDGQQIGSCILTTKPDTDTTDVPVTGICSTANPCPSGQFCFNGICALGCTNDSNCAANQYCDTFSMFCQNKEVPGCTANADCGEGRICKSGLCSVPPVPTTCTPRFDGPDGCDEYSLCLDEDEDKTACYSFPVCAQDLSCPTGLEGALCNVKASGDKYLPAKGKMCITGACETAANCPSAFKCVTPAGWPLGGCSNGQELSLCAVDADCASGLTCDKTFGFCSSGSIIPGGCTSDADCEFDEVCNTMFNMCEPDF